MYIRLVSKIAGVNETLDLEFGKMLFRVLHQLEDGPTQTGMVVEVSSNSKNGEEDHYGNHWGKWADVSVKIERY